MSQLMSLGIDNGSWLQFEPLNCEPDNLRSYN